MQCRVCDSSDLVLAIDLGEQPCANLFLSKEQLGEEPLYPLRVVYCQKCQCAQLDVTVKKEIVYRDHTYLSGMTRSLSDHFLQIAQQVDERFFKATPGKSVLDIGSNDGTQLLHYQTLNYSVLGVEPSERVGEIARQRGVETAHAFFNDEFAKQCGRQFHVINAAGVFFHLEELHSATEGVKRLLKEEGVFVIHFLYMKSILRNSAFDQIYHEHLLYYTLKTLEKLLNRHGLALFDAEFKPIHGGSIIGYAGHAGRLAPSERLQRLRQEEEASGCNRLEAYLQMAQRIEEMRRQNRAFLESRRAEGKRIFGMGAPVKGNTLLNFFRIDQNLLECLVEKNPLRKGLFSPGMHLPVVLEEELTAPPDVYYVLAWNFREEILQRHRALLDQGVEFYFPIEPK